MILTLRPNAGWSITLGLSVKIFAPYAMLAPKTVLHLTKDCPNLAALRQHGSVHHTNQLWIDPVAWWHTFVVMIGL